MIPLLSANILYNLEQVLENPFFTVHPFFVVLFWVQTVFIVLVMSIPIISALVNVLRKRSSRKKAALRTVYENTLFEYLAAKNDTVPVFAGIHRAANKDLLINIIFELMDYMDGEERRQLRTLFNAENLGEYASARIHSAGCWRKAYYLERLSALSCNRSSEEVFRDMLSSPFRERRMYAMQALIARNPEHIEALFAGYKFDLSLWEQMNYYLFFINREIPVPDFHRLSLSPNRGVALFAIRMVRMFNQKQGSMEGYESLLKHPDLQIQIEMFRTLAEFGYSNLDTLLADFLPQVSPPVRLHIMTYLAKTKYATAQLLMQYYEKDESPEFRLHILYCIYNFIAGGKEDIEHFTRQTDDRMLRKLSIHLIKNVV